MTYCRVCGHKKGSHAEGLMGPQDKMGIGCYECMHGKLKTVTYPTGYKAKEPALKVCSQYTIKGNKPHLFFKLTRKTLEAL